MNLYRIFLQILNSFTVIHTWLLIFFKILNSFIGKFQVCSHSSMILGY